MSCYHCKFTRSQIKFFLMPCAPGNAISKHYYSSNPQRCEQLAPKACLGGSHWPLISDRPPARREGQTVTASHPPWLACALRCAPFPTVLCLLRPPPSLSELLLSSMICFVSAARGIFQTHLSLFFFCRATLCRILVP